MAEPAKYFTVKTLAARWDCSANTIRNLIRDGHLGHVRIGASIRIKPCHVEAYESEHEECQEKSGSESNTLSKSQPEKNAGISAGQKIVGLSAFQRGRLTKLRPDSSRLNG